MFVTVKSELTIYTNSERNILSNSNDRSIRL